MKHKKKSIHKKIELFGETKWPSQKKFFNAQQNKLNQIIVETNYKEEVQISEIIFNLLPAVRVFESCAENISVSVTNP